MVERYDTLVLGGGMSGLPLALRAGRHGRVAFVEKEKLGGTCLNRGCIPTKTMIASAAVAAQIRRAGEFGVRVGDPEVDLAAVVDRKDKIVDTIRTGSYRTVERAATVDLYQAEGHFTGRRRLRVDGSDLQADRIVVATGLRTAIPAIDGLDTIPYLTSRTLLDLRELPEHLIVVGGGYIGCEFAQMFRRFGARVTIIQRADRLLPAEDPDISAAVTDGFTADDIDILTDTACVAVDGKAGDICIHCDNGTHLTGSHLLIATGRTPNTDDLGLEHLGLEPDAHGFLTVDDTLHTKAENVWAIGDIRGGPMFTHTARHDADVAYRAAFRGQARTTAGRVVPHGVFLDPEVGAVGLTEPQARAAGHDVVIGSQDFAGVVRARAIGSTRGLIKFVVDADTDKILGCHIAGPHAAELVHEAVIAMHTGARYTDIADAIHIHPTLAEGVNTAAGGVHREVGT
ncbi:dihydrolipoamide dehydrogenase [Kribbella aluminosa]|uniref:Dihydrolipoyl dehydrogenase n=1 Tax=Kribbella aluminosa TaxID=416017 RepID=A0ABS4UWH3_9ACTN|nr:dihydrolipoyl dehydrogenase [Kribbella aluminosa]MBP2355999.1 dihydrolipoamide dehydrogenase [Kribbella aluminosa]